MESAKAKAFRIPKVRPGILWFEVLLLCSLGMQLTGAYASMTTVIPILAVAVILLVWELHGRREASERMGEGACEGA